MRPRRERGRRRPICGESRIRTSIEGHLRTTVGRIEVSHDVIGDDAVSTVAASSS